MKRYLKAMSVLLVLSSSVYLPTVNAANSTAMLISIAEASPALVERLNVIALNDKALLNNLLTMADSDSAQLEQLLNLLEADPATFKQLAEIVDATTASSAPISTLGIIDDDGGIIRN
jgi:hypothetical protein